MDTTWADLHAAARRPARHLTKADVPFAPGVYAWYRNGTAVASHLGNSRSISGSAFRRNVAESLGIASAADIKSGRYSLTDAELAAVRAWIMGCEIAWLQFPSKEAAEQAERDLKAEWKPSGPAAS